MSPNIIYTSSDILVLGNRTSHIAVTHAIYLPLPSFFPTLHLFTTVINPMLRLFARTRSLLAQLAWFDIFMTVDFVLWKVEPLKLQ